jgi:hypothetical protein
MYLIQRNDPLLWNKVLTAENDEVKQLVVKHVVQLCQSKNEEEVSEIINAMPQAILDILAAVAPATSAAAPSKRKRPHTHEPSTDRVHIPTNRWETPDSQDVVALTDFFGDAASGRPGVPVGQTRKGITFVKWSQCWQDRTLLSW